MDEGRGCPSLSNLSLETKMKKIYASLIFMFLLAIVWITPGKCYEIVEKGTFYSVDIASIGDDETYTTDSSEIDVTDVNVFAVQGYSTGGSACVATTVIKFLAKVNGAWDDDGNPYVTLTITQTASTTVRKTALIDVSGIDKIKITSIENTEDDDTNGDITLVNCSYSKKY